MKTQGKFLLVSLLVVVVMSNCAAPVAVAKPMPTDTSTSTPTVTSTMTPTPWPTNTAISTLTLLPTSTPTVVPTIAPTVVYTSSFQGAQDALYSASLNYLADTPEKAGEVVRRIAFVDGKSESASNACGPITVAIMKDADLLPPSTSVHNIWLLCAREGKEDCWGIDTLQREYFPPVEYNYTLVSESIRTYDFVSNPLQPGDWMYLFVGWGGFDHMLLVTRVDDDGAAYTVTNLNRGDGFKIVEDKLYDPNNPGEGLFYELTDRKRGMLGVTGTGGFLLIRRKGGISSDATDNRLNVLSNGAGWNVLVKELDSSSILFESLPNQKFHPASMIKIPIAMTVLKIFEYRGLGVSDAVVENYDGRTVQQLMYAMVVHSEEDASYSLLKYVRSYGGEENAFGEWNIHDTTLEPRRTTAFDLAKFLEGLYTGRFLNQELTNYLLDLMSVYTENDSEFLGAVSSIVEGSVFYNKRGSLLDPTIVGDMGILVVGNRAYILIVCGIPKKDGSASYEEIRESIENFSKVIGDAITKQ